MGRIQKNLLREIENVEKQTHSTNINSTELDLILYVNF